jgi:hypothetical protein
MQSKLHDSLPTLLLAMFILIANTAIGLHYGLSIQPSGALNLVYAMGIFWGLSWWLINDSQKYEWKWYLDWGIFLYVVGWLLVPFYLFKTRGTKAFLILFLFITFYLGTLVGGLIYGSVISMLMRP